MSYQNIKKTYKKRQRTDLFYAKVTSFNLLTIEIYNVTQKERKTLGSLSISSDI